LVGKSKKGFFSCYRKKKKFNSLLKTVMGFNPKLWGPHAWKVYLLLLWKCKDSTSIDLSKMKRWVEIFLAFSPCEGCLIHGSQWFRLHAFPTSHSELFRYAVTFRNYVNKERTSTPERSYEDVLKEYQQKDEKLLAQEWWKSFYNYMYFVCKHIKWTVMGLKDNQDFYIKHLSLFLNLTMELLPSTFWSKSDTRALTLQYLQTHPLQMETQVLESADYLLFRNKEFQGKQQQETKKFMERKQSSEAQQEYKKAWDQHQKQFETELLSEMQYKKAKGLALELIVLDGFSYLYKMYQSIPLPGTCLTIREYRTLEFENTGALAKQQMLEKTLSEIPENLQLRNVDPAAKYQPALSSPAEPAGASSEPDFIIIFGLILVVLVILYYIWVFYRAAKERNYNVSSTRLWTRSDVK
jgi:hypothetical protein